MDAEELAGLWWLPDDPGRQISGTLTFDGIGSLSLELMEPLSADGAAVERVTLLGVSTGAEPITAQINHESRRQMRRSYQGHRVERQTVVLDRAIVGAHLPGPDERRFARIAVRLTDLRLWTGWPGPRDDWEWDPDRLSIRYQQPAEVPVAVSWGTVTLAGSWEFMGGARSRTIKVDATFRCDRQDRAPVETWVDEVVGPLQDFLSVATDRANQVDEVLVEVAERKPWARLIYAPLTVELPPATDHWSDFPFTATSLADRFGPVLSRWFALIGTHRSAFDLYLSTQYRRSMHLENVLLNTAGAIEAYHRTSVPPSSDRLQQHKDRLDRIGAQIADAGDRKWVKGRLRKAYEPSLQDMVAGLAARCDEVLGPWVGSPHEFGERAATVRNRLIHPDPGEDPLTYSQVVHAAEDLALVFLACTYLDLGFDLDLVREMLGRTRRWRALKARKQGGT